jgi:hypothetical protein
MKIRFSFNPRKKEMRMGKLLRTLLILSSAAVCVGGIWSACKKGMQAEDYAWTTIDEYYVPQNYVEEFIKKDAEEKGILPVQIRDYARDKSILKKFRGTNFARPNEAALNMSFQGLEDWMLVDIKYTNERKQEVLRTVLYVQVGGSWRVGDSGSLLK